MSQRIKNNYFYSMWMKIKEEQWFGVDFVFSFFVAFVEALIYYFLFRCIFAESSKVEPMQITLYYIVINLVSMSMNPAMFSAWRHMTDINQGSIIPYLLRPNSYVMTRYLESLSVFLLKGVINMVIIGVVAVIFHSKMSFGMIVTGYLSMVLGFTILYLIQSILGCMTVWFHEINKLRNVCMTLLMILGGQVIPSDLLFSWLKRAVYYTPIPYVYDIPVKVLMGNAGAESLLIQIVWVAVFAVIYRELFEHCVRHNIEFGS